MRMRVMAWVILLALLLACPAEAWYSRELDYMAIMLQSACEADWETGQYAQFARDAKIDDMRLHYKKVSYEDLYLLACLISAASEAEGRELMSEVGDGTVAETLFQPGACQLVSTGMCPEKESVLAAKRLLEENSEE
ncbi:MAG: hypothetical protein ACOX81_08755 [Candidatus Heteroscillospira sp.]|jgi:hypothetical protein